MNKTETISFPEGKLFFMNFLLEGRMPMRKLEFYVCNGEEKYDYRLIAELGKKEILKADRWGNIKDRIRLPKPMEFT